MHLPVKEYTHYAAIDPGFEGAIAVMNRAGTTAKVWDMPTTAAEGKKREMDLVELRTILKGLRLYPSVALGIEWPTTRPGEGAERSERFGRGKGYLEAFAFLLGFDYFKLAPHAWKGRLGLPGKTDPTCIPTCVAFLEANCGQWAGLIRGPKGGVRDGRLDALLMAHFLRDQRAITDTVRRHGKDSPEATAAILGWGGTRRRHRLRIR